MKSWLLYKKKNYCLERNSYKIYEIDVPGIIYYLFAIYNTLPAIVTYKYQWNSTNYYDKWVKLYCSFEVSHILHYQTSRNLRKAFVTKISLKTDWEYHIILGHTTYNFARGRFNYIFKISSTQICTITTPLA